MPYIQFNRPIRRSWRVAAGDCADTTGYERYWETFVKLGLAQPVEELEALQHRIVYLGKPRLYRPTPDKLTDATKQQIRIALPEEGAFNPAIVAYKSGYLFVYRSDEFHFVGCRMNAKFEPSDYFAFTQLGKATDPRLIWHGDRLLLSYSSYSPNNIGNESIKAAYVFDNDRWIDAKTFAVSRLSGRQKNWAPFDYEGEILFIQSICPHVVYNLAGQQVSSSEWEHPWFYDLDLRGNTPALRLDDGNYLCTFHTAARVGLNRLWCYDNGAYIFEGKPPFKVLKCTDKTYLPAEAGIEPSLRRHQRIQCCFPVGMVRKKSNLIISYGDQDSCCKVMKTTVNALESLMVDA